MTTQRIRMTKTTRDIRKTRNVLSSEYDAKSRDDLYREERETLEWWSRTTGRKTESAAGAMQPTA
jgi:hypothetical protein